MIDSRLRALSSAFQFARAHGARLRSAGILIDWADALELRRDVSSERRAARLYLRAEELLLTALPDDGAEVPVRAEADAGSAHRLLRSARAPYRAALASFAQLCLAGALVLAFLFAIACAGAPRFRHRWFPVDLAVGRAWRASSAWGDYPSKGVGPSSSAPIFFHTQDTEHPWLEIDLGGEHLIRAIKLVNRTDCCQMRAVPIDVRVLEGSTWSLIAERRSPFKAWTRDVEPVRARLVRVQLPGSGMLHLNSVSIYGE